MLGKLLLPLVVSGINLILPIAFRIIASLERYRSPRTTINVNLLRYNFMYSIGRSVLGKTVPWVSTMALAII